MKEDESLQTTDRSSFDPSPKISAYQQLIRQSRKLGDAATRTRDMTKDFFMRDVSLGGHWRPESIVFGGKPGTMSRSVSDDEIRAIKSVVQQSHEILAGARTVPLPINLFPDSITVDRTKVTIRRQSFFWTSQVITTRIEDILGVTSNLGPIFGSLTISTRIMNSTDHYEINYFWRKDAEYLKQLIQGYVIVQHNMIETKHMTRDELVETLLEIGRDSWM